MRKLTKIMAVLIIAAMMVLSIRIQKSFADRPHDPGSYVQLSFGGEVNAISNVTNGTSVTVTYENGTVTVTGTGLYSAVEQGPNGQGQIVNKYNVYAVGDVTITAIANEGFSVSYFVDGQPENTTTLNYTLAAGDRAKNIDAMFDHVPGGNEDITINANFTGTYVIAAINNITFMDDVDGEFKNSFDDVVPNAGTTDENETNIFRFINVFGDDPVATYTINGVNYTSESENVVIDQDGWYIITVPGSPTYTITGVAVPDPNKPRTIIWTNPDYVAKDAEDAEWTSQFAIKNGYARAIAVYDADNNKLDPDAYINTQVQPDGSQSDEYGLNNGFGRVEIRPGSRAVFEFVPDYGYQLTSIKLNEQEVDATGVTNQFEIVIPQGGGNVHFAAEFTKTDDVLKSGSDSVSGGSITLPDGSIENGTAQLTVNDVELSADKITGFQNAANGYTVSKFLDIDLYQVFYKGKNDDEDVWSNKIDELDGEATITLQLAEGVSADDIVIVHNIHDGDEYEVIEIESYDEATNTITFKAKSFSNYAIATKGESKSKLPKTGDSIFAIAVAGIITVAALVIVAKAKKNNK